MRSGRVKRRTKALSGRNARSLRPRPRRRRWRLTPLGRAAALGLPLSAFGGQTLDAHLAELRKRRNEAAAIAVLKELGLAQALYRRDESCHPPAPPGRATRYGYVFRVLRHPWDPDARWLAVADPVQPGVSGDRHFVLDPASLIVRASEGPVRLVPTGPGR